MWKGSWKREGELEEGRKGVGRETEGSGKEGEGG